MTVLSFGAIATVGSLRYTGGIAAIQVSLSIGPGVGSARITFPRDLRVEAKPGDTVVISLTGESPDEVLAFTGSVSVVHRGVDTTTVLCGDGSSTLAAIRTGSTFERQGASAIAKALAREARVDVGVIDVDLDLPCYVADQGRTAWEHLTILAGWGGAFTTCAADGTVEVRRFPSPPADTALRYGREIAELTVTAVAPAADVLLTGNGPAGNASDPRAPQQSTGTLPDAAPGPAAHTIRVAAPALRTPSAVASANQAYADRNGAARLSAACWLVPRLRAGTTVEIAEAPAPESAGPWLLTRVVHTVGPGPAARTTFEAINMATTGGSSLLGRVVGAVGGLL
ncbi:hypothetical protein CQY20_09225 [Mycolicibacterium agri]|uniref:Uncharacterized protein n=1 Tax=Mycolicibacterium agri TaxID=36811 RepID=A0A2A7N759_MYCAG|nr:hypothetical protein [Mycolicibacterium agri]PEG39724.1 hypothetical protein CQY20_09225 [Mycolicibacterium agri]GFG52569.1 hypothetical protein MAGR_40100 [Mycolicibacterium agri]